MGTKQYFIKRDCSDHDLEKFEADGWTREFMQFTTDARLHVVFVRDCPPTPSKQPFVGTVMAVEPVRSVAYTHNRAKRGDTRPVTMPLVDPVMELALQRSKAVYNTVLADGESMISQASKAFKKGV